MALQELHLCGYTGRPPHRDIHKAALGAEVSVNWQAWDNGVEALEHLRTQGYLLVAVEQTEPSQELHRWAWDGTQPLALVFGNEVEGLDSEILGLCDMGLEIPQWGTKHSLNVAVSAGIVFWEMARIHALQSRT
jgi:tRNA G18 (ribose-2'-O)-methylase SpoU